MDTIITEIIPNLTDDFKQKILDMPGDGYLIVDGKRITKDEFLKNNYFAIEKEEPPKSDVNPPVGSQQYKEKNFREKEKVKMDMLNNTPGGYLLKSDYDVVWDPATGQWVNKSGKQHSNYPDAVMYDDLYGKDGYLKTKKDEKKSVKTKDKKTYTIQDDEAGESRDVTEKEYFSGESEEKPVKEKPIKSKPKKDKPKKDKPKKEKGNKKEKRALSYKDKNWKPDVTVDIKEAIKAGWDPVKKMWKKITSKKSK